MAAPSASALTHARAAWLSGDASAWAHYLACVRRLQADALGPKHPAPERRPKARA